MSGAVSLKVCGSLMCSEQKASRRIASRWDRPTGHAGVEGVAGPTGAPGSTGLAGLAGPIAPQAPQAPHAQQVPQVQQVPHVPQVSQVSQVPLATEVLLAQAGGRVPAQGARSLIHGGFHAEPVMM